MRKLSLKILLVVGSIFLIGLLITNYNYYYGESSTLKLCMDEARDENTNYDFVILGSSTAYSSYSTEIIDNRLGVNSLNLGSEFQLVCDSNEILKDYLKYNNPKYIVFEVDPYYFWSDYSYIDTMSNSTTNVLPALKPSFNKMKYTCEMMIRRPELAKDFITYSVNPKRLMAPYESNYNWGEFEADESYIMTHKGDKLYTAVLDEATLKAASAGFPMDYSMGWDYLEKFVASAKDSGAELIFVTSGPTDAYVESCGTWEEIHNGFAEATEKAGAKYYDFTYAKPELWDKDITDWADNVHLNAQGAIKVTNALCDVIEADNTDRYFYSDYQTYTENAKIK